MPHIENALAGLPYNRKRFGQQSVKCFTVGNTSLQFGRLATQLLVIESLHDWLKGVDLLD